MQAALIRCISERATTMRAGPPARRVVSVRAFQVTMQSPDGQSKCFAAEAGSSLLEGALAAGVDTPHLCRTGTCGACAAKLLEGSVDRSDFLLDDAQAAAGYVLLCTATPTSDVTVLTGQETDMHTVPYGL